MEEDRHFLADRQFSNIQYWEDWKKEWDKSVEVKILLSLLHYGFKMKATVSEAIERIQLYLRIADLHTRVMTRDFGSSEAADLATKAFQVLCVDFFGKPAHVVDDQLVLRQHAVIRSIMYFFRAKKDVNMCWLENLPPGDHRIDPRHRRTAEKFILYYLKLVWEKSTEAEIASGYTFQVIDTLMALERLPDLLKRPYCGDRISDSFDFNAMGYMKGLAQDPRYIPPSDIRSSDDGFQTPEEAAALGSIPAQIYLLLRNREEQFRRLRDLKDAEEKVRVAEYRLAELRG